jgi:hypothetical protein
VADYMVSFSAVSSDAIPANAGARLADVLGTMPGVGQVDGASGDGARRRLSAAFVIDVEHGMADAARDGSRLAKEALNVAGMPDAQLVRLGIILWDDRLEDQ